MSYRTPGVYVEEISKLPASVAQSETAIPAFIGYTELTEAEEGSLLNKPIRIDSMMDYEKVFGGPAVQKFEVELEENEPYLPKNVQFKEEESPFLMHHALNLYFANGGGSCFIVSTGGYADDDTPKEPDADELKAGLDSIEKNDEITLVVIPEAGKLSVIDQHGLYEDVLSHNNGQVNRFGIFDVRKNDEDASDFRNEVSSGPMDKAAAYFPHLKTTIRYPWEKDQITISGDPFDDLSWKDLDTARSVLELQKQFKRLKEQVKKDRDDSKKSESDVKIVEGLYKNGFRKSERAFSIVDEAAELVEDESFEIDGPEDFLSEVDDDKNLFDQLGEDDKKMDLLRDFIGNKGNKSKRKDALDVLADALEEADKELNKVVEKINDETKTGDDDQNDEILKYFSSDFTSKLTDLLDDKKLTMPPSPAIAGVYAKVDADRGVWKSPANVSLNRVTGPSVKLTISENDRLNVHASGKSINAIRAFPGKGTLVWGARTLDGSSNEWRYISVRRFFNMVEDSVKSASARFVFEPNDAGTWVKVKAMIENFLTTQWRAGALMGSKPEEAFYVKVGLNETMDENQILEGKMIIEIGMAVVRPAEFIVLRFSHKMMES